MVLPEELRKVQQRWLTLARKDQDELYAEEFAIPFARLFSQLPLFGAPASLVRPRALASLLGFSWQPVALMTAWCHPERILVLGTAESLKMKVAGEGVLSVIARVGGIDSGEDREQAGGRPHEEDIYRPVREFSLLFHSGARELR